MDRRVGGGFMKGLGQFVYLNGVLQKRGCGVLEGGGLLS